MASKPLSKGANAAAKGKKRPLTARDANVKAAGETHGKSAAAIDKKELSIEMIEGGSDNLAHFKTCAFDPSLVSLYDIAD